MTVKKQNIHVTSPQKKIFESNKAMNLFMAGVGSGKSFEIGLLSGKFVYSYPEAIGLISANTYSQLSKSTLKAVFKVWHEVFGWVQGQNYVVDRKPPPHFKIIGEELKDYKATISFVNGATIWTPSLENYKAIDGTEVAYALLDETKDTREEAVSEVIIARLRQKAMSLDDDGNIVQYNPSLDGYNPLFIFTSPAKEQWINELFKIDENIEEINKRIFSKDDFFVYKDENRCVVISSSYHNEHNLPKGYIDKIIAGCGGDKNLINMLVYGSPIAKTGGEWFSQFDREEHVIECDYDPEYPLHITMDQNVNPYISALIIQEIPVGNNTIEVRILKEYALKNPKNNTESLAEQIRDDWGKKLVGFYYYGDTSGRSRNTVSKSIRHDYQMFEHVLEIYIHSTSNCVPRAKPPMNERQTVVNRLMNGSMNYIFVVDPSCKHMINDFEFLKEDGNGGYVKPKTRDSEGRTYEKLGHHGDAFVYYAHERFNWFIYS